MAATALPSSAVLERRKEIADAEALSNNRLSSLPDNLDEFWTNIELPDGYHSRTLVMRPHPKSPLTDFLDSPRIVSLRKSPKRPMLIYFHGGGWYGGSPMSCTLAARLLAEAVNATVLVPTYRLVPENPWPAPYHDALSIVQTVASNPTYHYGADLEQGFMIAGFSAGGSLAAVVAGLTTADPQQYPLYFPLTGVFVGNACLFVESILPSEHRERWTSREENRDTESAFTPIAVQAVATLNCSDHTSPLFSPINNPSETRHRHPPICLHSGVRDAFRDDIIIYGKVLAEAGVKTRMHIVQNNGHDILTSMRLLRPIKDEDSMDELETLNAFRWLAAQVTP